MSDTNYELVLARPDLRKFVVVVGGFTAALCWWIGITGLVNTGGGGAVFLTVPVLATLGTVLAARASHPAPGRQHRA